MGLLDGKGFDPLGMKAKNTYKEAVGASIDSEDEPVAVRVVQPGSVPIPANVQGLANLLLKTNRAKDMADALNQARQMTAGR